jgi:hypothetical protein
VPQKTSTSGEACVLAQENSHLVGDEEILAVTRKINFDRISERLQASSEDFRERHRVSQDDLALEVSF